MFTLSLKSKKSISGKKGSIIMVFHLINIIILTGGMIPGIDTTIIHGPTIGMSHIEEGSSGETGESVNSTSIRFTG